MLASMALALAVPAEAGLLQELSKPKASTPTVLSPGTDPVARVAELVVVDRPEVLSGQRKFALTSFTVEFQIMARDFDTQFGSTTGSKTRLFMDSVSQADMQAMTD